MDAPAALSHATVAETRSGPAGALTFTDEQRAAADLAMGARGLVVITGGPGTGKTAVLAELARRLAAAGAAHAFVAPTGTAAENVAAAVGGSATVATCAGLLVDELRAPGLRGEGVLVCDEASMLTLERLGDLLTLGPARVVLVGDADQLPPQPEDDGTPATPLFADLIDCERVPTARLTRDFRQGAGALRDAVHALRDAWEPVGRRQLRAADPSFRYLDGDPLEAVPAGLPAAELPVFLCCSNRLRAELNDRMQRRFNAEGREVCVATRGRKGVMESAVRVGDPVVCTRNFRDRAGRLVVANGTRGVVEQDDDRPVVRYRRADGAVAHSDYFDAARRRFATEFVVAYAMTVHKAQGQGIPRVVVVVEGYETHAWFYTAVSRAIESCEVVNGTEPRLRAITARRRTRGAGSVCRGLRNFDFAQLDPLAP